MSVGLVGVLNRTPDSFSDGGLYMDAEKALAHTEQMFADGASYVDIGGEATNPNAEPISIDEEWRRLEPILSKLLPVYGEKISVDTRHPEIVERAIKYGRFIVNDVTTFIDPEMIRITAKHGLTAIASHLPEAANGNIQEAHDFWQMSDIGQVYDELMKQQQRMEDGGIAASRIILDPGIGFGKTMQLNWKLLDFPHYWASNQPAITPTATIMIGASRKRFLASDPNTGFPLESVNRYDPATSVAAAEAAIQASPPGQRLLLRVHDVAAHRELITD